VVFSRGESTARVMLVGEQRGDHEDREGQPFVGPAGQLLAKALDAAGVDQEDLYLTNAVKHFRHEQRGKRRIHRKPELRHLVACHPWLEAEIAVVDPAMIICCGATAGRAVLGRPVQIGKERGVALDELPGRAALITTHPSALLRMRRDPDYDDAFDAFVSDLQVATRHVGL